MKDGTVGRPWCNSLTYIRAFHEEWYCVRCHWKARDDSEHARLVE